MCRSVLRSVTLLSIELIEFYATLGRSSVLYTDLARRFFRVFLVSLSTGDSLGSFAAFLSLTRVSTEGTPLREGHPRSKVQVHSTRILGIQWNSPRLIRLWENVDQNFIVSDLIVFPFLFLSFLFHFVSFRLSEICLEIELHCCWRFLLKTHRNITILLNISSFVIMVTRNISLTIDGVNECIV